MTTYYIYAFFAFLLALAALAFFIFLMIGKVEADKQVNEDEKTLKENFNTLKSDIRRLEQKILKSNSDTISQSLQKIYIQAKKAYIKQRKNYNTKQIFTIKHTSSDTLGLCGISNTDFYYQLDEIYDLSHSSVFTNASTTNDIEYYSQIESDFSDVKNLSGQIKKERLDDIEENLELLQCNFNFYKKLITPPVKTNEKRIPLSNIHYFKIDGNVQYTSSVTGGGVNARGAIAGAVIGGDAAAIIGSQIGTEITTSTNKHDDRKISLVYSQNGTVKTLDIKTTDVDATLNALRKLIPQKEETFVLSQNNNQKTLTEKATEVSENSSANLYEQIAKLKELLDCGALTQEEFNAKKKQLLDL